MTKFNIAVDIDQVLSRTLDHFLDYINSTYNFNFTIDDITEYNLASIEKYFPFPLYQELINFIDSSLETFSILDNSKEVLMSLKDEHNLSVLTSRSEIFGERTRKWIDDNFGSDIFDEVYILETTGFKCKSDFCKENNFDVLIDDEPHFTSKARDKGIYVILFSYPCNLKIEECNLLKRVNGWNEVREKISYFQKN